MHSIPAQDLTLHLRRLVDHVPSMLAYWDTDTRCRFANRAYEQWFGVDPDQLIGKTLRELLGPKLYALNEPFILGALRGEAQSFERVVPGPGGIQRHSLAHYLPDIVDGAVAGFIVTVTEVTQLKETEAKLRAVIAALETEISSRHAAQEQLVDTQQSLAVTLASIDAGFIATDRHGRVTLMNAVSERVTGWAQAEAAGRPLFEVFAREDRPIAITAMNPVDVLIEQGITVETAHHVIAISRQGALTPLQVQAALTYGADKEVRGVAMVMRDMSQAMRAEFESNRLAAIVESSYDAIIAKTLDGRITNWNAAAESLFGYTAAEAIGQAIQLLIPPDRFDEEMLILANLSRGVRIPAFDTVRRAKDGRLIDVSVTISPIRDALGRIVGASKIVRDATQRKLAEQARSRAERLEAENRQIQEASRLKSQFVANMSHELRTPLNAVIGFADLLLSGQVPPDSPKQAVFLGHIATSGRHLLQLINDVLDLAKVESGKFEFFPTRVNLNAVVKEVGDILHTALDRKGIRLAATIDPQLDDLFLDPARLKQVLYNLLSNAIKFTPEGGRVKLRANAQGPEHFLIEVEDNGIGIAADQIDRLFVEFQQLDTGYGKQHQGTGLGLALTRRLIEAQGGSVAVRSELGQGSVFSLRLHRRPDTGSPQTAPAQAEPGSRAEPAAPSPRPALHVGLSMDLQLPDHSGLVLQTSIRNDGLNPSTPVVGMQLSGQKRAAAWFAIADILCKPIRIAEVAAVMSRLDAGNRPGTKVMVIDDDVLALDLMRTTLEGLDIEAICHTDGRVALHELVQSQPAAIVLDLMMPEFDGFAVLDALHAMPMRRHTPVFIWTSMSLTDEEYTILAQSAQAVLSKGGGDIAAMLERLRRWRTPVEL